MVKITSVIITAVNKLIHQLSLLEVVNSENQQHVFDVIVRIYQLVELHENIFKFVLSYRRKKIHLIESVNQVKTIIIGKHIITNKLYQLKKFYAENYAEYRQSPKINRVNYYISSGCLYGLDIENNMKDAAKELFYKINTLEIKSIKNIIEKKQIFSHGKSRIVLDKFNYTKLLKVIPRSEERRKLFLEYNFKNMHIFNEVISLIKNRTLYANMNNYDSHLEQYYDKYFHFNKIPDVIKNIKSIYSIIEKNINNKFINEITTLSKIKKKQENTSKLNIWDIEYYVTQWRNIYNIDHKYISTHFCLFGVWKMITKYIKKWFGLTVVKENKKISFLKELKKEKDMQVYSIKHKGITNYFYLNISNNIEDHIKFYTINNYMSDNKDSSDRLIGIINLNKSIVNNNYCQYNHIANLWKVFGKIIGSVYFKKDIDIDVFSYIWYKIAWSTNIIIATSKHKKTNKKLPIKTVEKLIKAKNINTGIKHKTSIINSCYHMLLTNNDKNIAASINTNDTEILVNLFQQLVKKVFKKKVQGYNNPMIFNSVISNIIYDNNELNSNVINDLIATDIHLKYFKEEPIVNYQKVFTDIIKDLDSIKWVKDIIANPLSVNFNKIYQINDDPEMSIYLNTENTSVKKSDTEKTISNNNISSKPKKKNKSPKENSDYFSETSESLKRYKNIFVTK